MSDPDDIHNASNTAYFFVLFRLAWYIICCVASLVAVIMLAIENANMLDELKDVASPSLRLTDDLSKLSSLCAFEYLAIPRAKAGSTKDDTTCPTTSMVNWDDDALAPSDSTTLRCNLVTGVLSTSVVYGLIMSVITGMLLFNKKVKVSQSIIIELVMAGTLAILSIAMAAMVTSRFATSCSDCITNSNWDYEPTCQEWAVIVSYNHQRPPKVDTGKGYVNPLPWHTYMSGLQDGLWATAIGWTVLTIMLRIRFKNARMVAKSPEFNNTVQSDYEDNLVEAPKGANAHAQDPQASPAPSYATNESAPPPPPAVQGNPFA